MKIIEFGAVKHVFHYSNRWVVLVGGLVAFGGCKPQPMSLGPEPMAPIEMEVVKGWVAELAPSGPTRYDFRWTFQTQRGAIRGQGAIRIQPPDSMRFDYRAPFGRSGAAFVVDDELVWAVPEGEVETLIQAIPLFWAALGMPRDPPMGIDVFGLEVAGTRRWEYGVGVDTLEHSIATEPPFRLLASMRRSDDVMGLVEVNYDDQTNLPTSASLTFPETASVFLLEVTEIDTTTTLSADVWKRP